jgi:hypothetical protein
MRSPEPQARRASASAGACSLPRNFGRRPPVCIVCSFCLALPDRVEMTFAAESKYDAVFHLNAERANP